MRYIGALSYALAALVLHSATAEAAAPAADEKKSIVPSKYAGKYKRGSGDAVARFFEDQCISKPDTEGKGGGDFSFGSYFKLARDNGIAEDKVAHYESEVASGKQGANGRARMTIGNMLRAKARKDGKLVALDGTEQTFEGLAKPSVSGAAAKAQEGELSGAAAEAAKPEARTDSLVTSTDVEDGTTDTDDE